MNLTEVRRQIIERSAQVLSARVTGDGTAYMTAAEVSSLAVSVFDESTGLQVGTAFNPDPADCVLDELRDWEVDDTGYNVQIPVSGDYFPAGGRTYRVEVKVTPAESQAFYLPIWRLDATEVMGE